MIIKVRMIPICTFIFPFKPNFWIQVKAGEMPGLAAADEAPAEFFKSPFSLAKRNVTRGRALTLSSAQSKQTNVISGKLFTSRG